MSWLVRIYRYDGSESTVMSGMGEKEARWAAASLNRETQSEQYRAEEYDPAKGAAFLAAPEPNNKETDDGHPF